MDKQDKGENSRKNEFDEHEKPLKKARYAWQIKGKHHLKEKLETPCNNNENELVSEKPCESHCSTSANSKKDSCGCVKPANKKCCIESFLAKTESIMNSDDEENSVKHFLESTISNEIPVTLVPKQPKNQDYYLRKWQARQIARGFVDNTINSVLETWVNPPLYAADFVENCENDGQIEDDAILMAIQSHGLQSSARGGLSLSTTDGAASKNRNEAVKNEIEECALDNLENFHKEQGNGSTDSDFSSNGDSMNIGGSPFSENIDFLGAAVAVAIQNKGLSYS